MKQCFTMLGCEISQEKKERKNPTNSKHNTQNKAKKGSVCGKPYFTFCCMKCLPIFLPTLKTKRKKRICKRTHEHYYFRVNFLFLYITKKNSSLLDETLLQDVDSLCLVIIDKVTSGKQKQKIILLYYLYTLSKERKRRGW